MAISRERRREVLLRLEHGNASRLAPELQLAYVIGLLVTDESGRQRHDAYLEDGAPNPEILDVARQLVRKGLS